MLELIAAPFTVYLAPVGEDFPDVDEVPAGNWFKLGSNGAKNYGEEGVSVSHPQTINEHRGLASTGPLAAYRTEEGLKIGLLLHDLTLEQYRKVLNDVAVTTTAASSGEPGIKEIPLRRGLTVAEYAVLVRGEVSPAMQDGAMQYQVPKAYVSSEPELVFQKGEPAGLQVELTALEDLDQAEGEEFGKLVVQTADAA